MHPSKTHQRFEVQVNKSSKTPFQTLGNSIIFCRNEAVVWTTETHYPNLLTKSGEMDYKIARLDKLLHKQHNVHRFWGSGSEPRTGQSGGGGEDKHWRKVDPALIQMCSLRQGAARAISMLETRQGPWSKQFSHSYFRDLAISLTNFGLNFWMHFTALLSLNHIYEVRMLSVLTKVLKLQKTKNKLETKQRREKLTRIPLRGRLSCILHFSAA